MRRSLAISALAIQSLAVCVSFLQARDSQAAYTLTSEVRMYKGTPALFINGKMSSQILAAPYIPGTSDFTDFLQAGISIFDIYLRFDWTGRVRLPEN
jgi:hypothetical protein